MEKEFGIHTKLEEGGNFHYWKNSIENVLMYHCSSHLLSSEPAIDKDGKPLMSDMLLDQKARAIILNSMSPTLFTKYKMEDLKTTKAMWLKICNDCQKKDAQQVFALAREFHTSEKHPNESMQRFVTRIKEIRVRLDSSGHKIDDQAFEVA